MNKPQAIVIIGNIASGKTTLAKKLIEQLPDFAYICLDQLRISVTESLPSLDINPVTRDRTAERIAMGMIDQKRYIIFESTGASQFYHRAIFRMRDKFQVFTVKLMADTDTLYARYLERRERGQFQLQPAHTGSLPMRDLIERQQNVIKGIYADYTLSTIETHPRNILLSVMTAYAATQAKTA